MCMSSYFFNVCHSQRDGTVLHMLCNSQLELNCQNQRLFLECVQSGGESARCFDISSAAYLEDGNSNQTWSQPLEAPGGLESKTSSLKVTNYPSERIGQQNKKKTVLPLC
ncbi:hypothetical protein AMECASPLE_004690 [Ameca splendens]|uniref:Uncharacterized protein n=1 Tax=Ameca splendens TaxID=208324 RepID=A0ABV0YXM7_9TELE